MGSLSTSDSAFPKPRQIFYLLVIDSQNFTMSIVRLHVVSTSTNVGSERRFVFLMKAAVECCILIRFRFPIVCGFGDPDLIFTSDASIFGHT